MVIERTKKEVIIRLPSYIDTEGLQNLINYLIYKEATDKSQAKQDDVDKLAKEIKKGWWNKNRRRFIK
jgi:thioredoxin-related protein